MKHRKILCFALLVIVFIGGYVTGTVMHRVSPILFQDPLVQITYDGGMYEGDTDPVASIRIFDNGDVFALTSTGKVIEHNVTERNKILELRNLVNTPEAFSAFILKQPDEQVCMSAVDGVDTIITLHLQDGSLKRYSDCEYAFNQEHELIEHIFDYTSKY